MHLANLYQQGDTTALWNCPSAPAAWDPIGYAVHYGYNEYLNYPTAQGWQMRANVFEPTRIIQFADAANWSAPALDFTAGHYAMGFNGSRVHLRHLGGSANIAYVDGHAESFPMAPEIASHPEKVDVVLAGAPGEPLHQDHIRQY